MTTELQVTAGLIAERLEVAASSFAAGGLAQFTDAEGRVRTYEKVAYIQRRKPRPSLTVRAVPGTEIVGTVASSLANASLGLVIYGMVAVITGGFAFCLLPGLLL